MVAVRLEHLPQVLGLLEVRPNADVTPIAPGLNLRAGERQELDLGVVHAKQRIDVPGADRLEAPADEFDVVRHR